MSLRSLEMGLWLKYSSGWKAASKKRIIIRACRLWMRYNAACDYVPLNTLAESAQMFAGFVPVN